MFSSCNLISFLLNKRTKVLTKIDKINTREEYITLKDSSTVIIHHSTIIPTMKKGTVENPPTGGKKIMEKISFTSIKCGYK